MSECKKQSITVAATVSNGPCVEVNIEFWIIDCERLLLRMN